MKHSHKSATFALATIALSKLIPRPGSDYTPP